MDNKKTIPKFQSIKSISNLVVIFLILSISITLIGDLSGWMEINLLSSIEEGITVMDEEIDANDFRVSVIAGIETIVIVISMILFFIWFYKAYKNLPSLGARELSFSSRWVIAYFFIPILWFYKPYGATKEIWKSSDPQIAESDKYSRNKIRTPSIIKAWWAFWIIANFIGWIYLRSFGMINEIDTISGFIAYNFMDMYTDIPLLISDILTLVLVRKISFNQEKKGNICT